MKRGAPLKRTPFARKNNAENIPAKVPQTLAQQAPTAIKMGVNMPTNYPAYFRCVKHLDSLDVYRVLELWGVHHPALQHALKKVLAAGQRGAKSTAQDVQEAIDSLQRWQAMAAEDAVLQARQRKEAETFAAADSYDASDFAAGGMD